jgi:hypothetical protein
VLADRRVEQRREAAHALAKARLDAGAGLAFEAGVLVARERQSLQVEDRRPACSPCFANPGPASQRQTLVTPEAALSWQPRAGALLFLRSARSARLPGWNLLARDAAELRLLPAETGWHHEAGVKADLWQDRLRVNASLFRATTQALASPLLGMDPIAMANAPQLDMTNRGLDVQVLALPLPQLELSGTLAVQRARWRGGAPAGAPQRPLFAPDVAASVSAAWRQVIPGAGANIVPRIGVDWRSAMAVAAGPVLAADGLGLLADGLAPAGWQVAAALQLEIPDGGWLISLECRNCLDQALVDGAVAGLPVPNRPRWWQLRFTRRF